MTIALMWVGLIVSIFVFLYLCNILFDLFCWSFCMVDNYLQERHFAYLRQQRVNTEELLKIFPEGEELAA
jgi:hypothetical protein